MKHTMYNNLEGLFIDRLAYVEERSFVREKILKIYELTNYLAIISKLFY